MLLMINSIMLFLYQKQSFFDNEDIDKQVTFENFLSIFKYAAPVVMVVVLFQFLRHLVSAPSETVNRREEMPLSETNEPAHAETLSSQTSFTNCSYCGARRAANVVDCGRCGASA